MGPVAIHQYRVSSIFGTTSTWMLAVVDVKCGRLLATVGPLSWYFAAWHECPVSLSCSHRCAGEKDQCRTLQLMLRRVGGFLEKPPYVL